MPIPWQKYYLWICLAVGLAAAIFLFFYWRGTEAMIQRALDAEKIKIYAGLEKPPRQNVKAVYLTAYSAGNPKKIDEIISLLKKTELNAVVIDIKDYSGLVLYDSRLPLVRQLGLKDNRLGNVSALVEKLHRNGVYVIARQTVFQDPVLAEKKPEWAVKSKKGGLWRDNKGLAWVDASRPEVWDYNLDIAREASRFGFDELNFDYVRFPSDGPMSEAIFALNGKKKYEVMGEFFSALSERLADLPVWLSLDFFGFTMEKTGFDDMNIGQRLADALDKVDYICPMMYPSHYPVGHLGFKNPAEHPAEVIENGMKMGAAKFRGRRAMLRPWLQAFDLGAIYDAEKIRAQIDATEKSAKAGWLLWNASNRYVDDGLKAE